MNVTEMSLKEKSTWFVINRNGTRIFLRAVLYIIVVLVMISAVFPLLWMLSTSFKTLTEALTWPPTVLPQHFTLEAYQKIFSVTGIFRYFKNSTIYAVFGMTISLLFSSLAGFAFAKYNFKGKNVLFALVLSTMMIPGQVTLIPVFITLKNLGWINTYLALIVPGLGDAFGIFLIRQFALAIPNELFDSARIDGAGELRIFKDIFIPLCLPPIFTLAVLGFMGRWNDLFWPLIVASNDSVRTLQLALINMQVSIYETIWNELTASMIIAAIPVMLLYIFFQRYFTEGIVMTGLKG